MVHFDIDGDATSAGRFAKAMKDRGVLISAREGTAFRAVTHYGITRADIDRTVSVASEAAAEVFGD
jgi:threonine aldolase